MAKKSAKAQYSTVLAYSREDDSLYSHDHSRFRRRCRIAVISIVTVVVAVLAAIIIWFVRYYLAHQL